MGKLYSVITADVVGSRKVPAFRKKRDAKLRALSHLHLARKMVLSPYAVTAWDEFQVILTRPEHTPRVMLDLRRLFYPMELWIAVGMGKVTEARRAPVNLYAGGEAFERARVAADRLKKGNPKYRLLTGFESGNDEFDTIANTIYRLHDAILEKITQTQWTTINLQIETGSQEETAKKLSRTVSTISRTLKRGSYWHLIETVAAMEKIASLYFPLVR